MTFYKLNIDHETREVEDRGMEIKLHIATTMLLQDRKVVCVSCGVNFEEKDIVFVDMYDHEGGQHVIEDWPKQWVSVHCACGYDTSLHKLPTKEGR